MTERMGVCAIIPRGQKGLQPQVFGMGILVTATEIVTCAHVVQEVLGLDRDQSAAAADVSVCFPFSGDLLCTVGTIDGARWFPPGEPGTPSDVAVIRLPQAVPAAVELATLRCHHLTQPDEIGPRAYGFRSKRVGDSWISHPKGEHAPGLIVGSLPGGRGQFDGDVFARAAVEKGYSGAGVYDWVQDAIVGMIVEADRDPDRKIANFIDAESLCKALGIPLTRLAYRPQAALVDQLGLHFVGRTTSIAEIDGWLERPEAPAHLLIEAPAGYGKSALVARLLELHSDWIYHFVREEDQQHTATSMLQSLCAQLSDRLGARRSYAGLAPTDLKDEFFRLQTRVAERLGPGGKLVIAIDGLDESAREGSQKLVQPELFRAGHPACRYLLSFRQGTISPAVELGLARWQLVALAGLESADVSALFKLLERPDLGGNKAFLDALVEKTSGEPFYLRFLAEELAGSVGPVAIPDDLPRDSQDYIARQVQGLQGEKLLALVPEALKAQPILAAQVASSILRLLVMAQDWLSRRQLTSIMKPASGANSILLNALIPATRRYFVTDRPDNPANELDEHYLVTPLRLRDGIRKAFLDDELREAETWLLDYCRGWQANKASYALNYLTHHLAAAGAYDELITTIDHGFLEAKTVASRGRQAVVTDIGRALAMALDREDAPKIVRMLLMMAQTRNAIQQEAAKGGIGLIAAQKLYDLAIDRATSISDQQVRFGQLLLVAEAALQNGDHIGLSALDQALQLDIRVLRSLRRDAAPLIDMLLVRNRDPNRALALASKIEANANDHLKRAALELMGGDSAFAISLAERIDDSSVRFRTLLSAADTLAATQPELTRLLIDKALGASRGKERYGKLIQIVPVLRRIDPAAALAMIREVMDAAQKVFAANPSDRGAAETLNQATAELAHHDLPLALDIALTRCPEIIDSLSTKVTTVASILTLALEMRVRIDLPKLPLALPVPVPIRATILDEYAAALAVHHARQGDLATAAQLSEQIKDDAVKAAAAVWSSMERGCDPIDLSQLIGRGRPETRDGAFTRRGLRQWFMLNPNETLKAVSFLADPKGRFDTCKALLDIESEHRSALVEVMRGAVTQMETPADRLKYALDLAGVLSGLGVDAPELLEQALDAIPKLERAPYESEVPTIARLARAFSRPDLATEAVRRKLDVVERADDRRPGDDVVGDIARVVADEAVDVDDESISRLFAAVRDPYTRGRIVVRVPRGIDYVKTRLGGSPLQLDELYFAIAAAAAREGCIDGAKQVLHRAESSETKSAILLRTGRAQAAVDPVAAKKTFLECIDTAIGAQVARANRRAQEERLDSGDDDEDEDTFDWYAFEAVIALGEIDPDAALQRLEGISPGRKGRALARISLGMADDPDRALTVLREALGIAEEEERPVNRFAAIANLAEHAEKTVPEFAADCRKQALDILPSLAAEDRADFRLKLLDSGKRWPLAADDLWAGLETDLGQVVWNIPNVGQIFSTAGKIADDAAACRAWREIIAALFRPGEVAASDAEITEATLRLAERGGKDDASAMLRYLPKHAGTDPWKFESRAYRVVLDHVLGDDSAPASLDRLLDDLCAELEQRQEWASSVVRSLEVLLAGGPWIVKREQTWRKALDLCARLANVERRAAALESLIVTALDHGERARALSLLGWLPVAASQAEAVAFAADRLTLGTEAASPAAAGDWRGVIDAAQLSAEGSLACAARWAKLHVAHAGPAGAAAAVAALLSEIEFVSRQAA